MPLCTFIGLAALGNYFSAPLNSAIRAASFTLFMSNHILNSPHPQLSLFDAENAVIMVNENQLLHRLSIRRSCCGPLVTCMVVVVGAAP